MAMTKEQRDRAMALRQVKSLQHAAKVATTSGLSVPMSEASEKIDKLACTVKSYDTKSADHSESIDHSSGPRQHKNHSWSGSSSHSRGSNQSGTVDALNIDSPGT